MINKRPTINITVSDKRVERNPRTARPMEDRTHLGKVRRPERNPRSVPATVDRSGTFIAKLRSRTCCNDETASSRRSVQSIRGTTEIDKLLAQRYGQVRLVPSRVYSYRNPYDLRDTSSCQSGTRRRTGSSGVDPRFRRTIRVVDVTEAKGETDPAHVNYKERQLGPDDPAETGPSQGSSSVSVAVQATSRGGDIAATCRADDATSQRSSRSSVAVQTPRWPPKVRAASARREDSGRVVTLKRSSSDTTLQKLRASRHQNRFRHGSGERRESEKPTPKQENDRNRSPSCEHCCQHGDDESGPDCRPVESGREREIDAERHCKHCRCFDERRSTSPLLVGQRRPTPAAGLIGESTWSKKPDEFFPPRTTFARRIKRDEGYVIRAVGTTVRSFVVAMILLSLGWFVFVGVDGLREWWSPPDAGWADTCKWFVLNTLRRITILEKCKCS